MNAAPDDPELELYRAYLAERFHDGDLKRLASMAGLELTEEEPDEAAFAIAGRLDTAEKIRTLLEEYNELAFELLLQLMECGDVFSPETLRGDVFGLSEEDFSHAFLLLRATGLVAASFRHHQPLVVVQPLARRHFQELVDRRRRERLDGLPREADPVFPLSQLLALCLNHVRGHRVKLRQDGMTVFRRHARRAAPIFAGLGEKSEFLFDWSVRALLALGALDVKPDRHLGLDADRAAAILAHDPTTLAIELLRHSGSERNLLLGLLHYASRRAWENIMGAPHPASASDSWKSERALRAHAEALFSQSDWVGQWELETGHEQLEIDGRLVELVFLGLLETCACGGERWYRITDTGWTVVARLEDDASDRDPDTEDLANAGDTPTAQAVFQPNLEVLVPMAAPGLTHWRVGALGRLESVDRICRYAIERDHILRVFASESHDAVAWIEAARRSAARGIPDNVLRTIEDWTQRVATVRSSAGTLLELAAGATEGQRQALEDAAVELRARCLAEGVYWLAAGTPASDVEAVLHERGLRPCNEHGEGPVRSQGEETAEPAPPDGESLYSLQADFGRYDGYLGNWMEPASLLLSSLPEQAISPRHEDEPQQPSVPQRPPHETDWIWRDSGELLSFLHEAVRHHLIVEIYLDGPYLKREHLLRPDTVLRRGRRVYLTGLCLDTSEHRAFPVEAIERARGTGAGSPQTHWLDRS